MPAMTTPIEDLDLTTLMALAERRAVTEADGHFTLMRFTTGWKCMIGTPNLDTGEGRDQVAALKIFPNIKEALVDFIVQIEV